MAHPTDCCRAWIVVEVNSGIPVCAELFKHESTARQRERELRHAINPEKDEVGIFEASIT